MALFLFTKAILEGRPIDVFNSGKIRRDFTYFDDIVEGVLRVTDRVAKPNPDWSGSKPDPGTSNAPNRIYNIGTNNPVELMHLIALREQKFESRPRKISCPCKRAMSLQPTWMSKICFRTVDSSLRHQSRRG
jgi:UDP-glucuronate 4-epimerase